MVRGRTICFDRDAINDYLGNPYTSADDDELCAYSQTLARGNWNVSTMVRTLLLPGRNLQYSRQNIPLRAKG
ncbi:hypothetical protein A2U01_0086437, partial [Trifolium medium]|nr:hypothetical protein [Trifolium medium]